MSEHHCCHETGEACHYGWSDVHYHRCVPPEGADERADR